ncbi:MAG: hypothetical protein VX899_11680 [Myxococcota bacterium]|nr:hypothetical protein [Myxococcota bacterium]
MAKDEDLDALMAELGISPTGAAKGKAPGQSRAGRSPAKKAPPKASPAQIAELAKRLGSQRKGKQKKKGAQAGPKLTVQLPKSDPDALLKAATRREEQLSVLLGEVDALAARTVAAEATAKELRREAKVLRAQSDQDQRARRQAERDLAGAKERIAVLEAELAQAVQAESAARKDQSSSRQSLEQLQTQAQIRPSLRAMMADRGLEPAEMLLVLEAMQSDEPELLLALRQAPDQRISQLLSERVVLVGPECAEAPQPGQWAVPVGQERCELSETGLALRYRDLLETCELLGIHTLCIVGGSTGYRKTLKQLAAQGDLKLRLVSGSARRQKRQAEADLRTSSRVVVWGGTELDHAVSDLYRGENVVLVNHRGLSGMLGELSRVLEG